MPDSPGPFPLAAVDVERRNAMEKLMEEGRTEAAAGCLKCGMALAAIRNEKLYADDYQSFGEYCIDLWSIDEDMANKWITSFQTVESLRDYGHGLEQLTISNSIALSRIDDPSLRATVWSEAKQVREDPSEKDIDAIAAVHLPLLQDAANQTVEEQQTRQREAERDVDRAINKVDADDWLPKFIKKIDRALETYREEFGDVKPGIIVPVSKIRAGLEELMSKK